MKRSLARGRTELPFTHMVADSAVQHAIRYADLPPGIGTPTNGKPACRSASMQIAHARLHLPSASVHAALQACTSHVHACTSPRRACTLRCTLATPRCTLANLSATKHVPGASMHAVLRACTSQVQACTSVCKPARLAAGLHVTPLACTSDVHVY